jgi:putative membrane protein
MQKRGWAARDTNTKEMMMRKILALLALASPLAFAPLAFGADDPDATFYKKAAEGGLFEIDTGNQAAKTSNNQQIKDLGSMLVTDHTAANDKLKALAASKNIALPTTASVGQMAQKAKLDVLTGDTYDKSFVKTQIKAHQQTIALFKKEIAGGQDADAKAFAKETLPTLRKHLKAAQSIAASAGYTTS